MAQKTSLLCFEKWVTRSSSTKPAPSVQSCPQPSTSSASFFSDFSEKTQKVPTVRCYQTASQKDSTITATATTRLGLNRSSQSGPFTGPIVDDPALFVSLACSLICTNLLLCESVRNRSFPSNRTQCCEGPNAVGKEAQSLLLFEPTNNDRVVMKLEAIDDGAHNSKWNQRLNSFKKRQSSDQILVVMGDSNTIH